MTSRTLADNTEPFYLSVNIILASDPPRSNGASNLLFEDLEYGLSLTTRLVIDVATSGSARWPPFPFLVLGTPP